MIRNGVDVVPVMRALADPVRWRIVRLVAESRELPCVELVSALRASKPGISYHMKILIQAGVIDVRKEGRRAFYTLQSDVVAELLDRVRALSTDPAAETAAPGSPRPYRLAPASRSAAGERTS